MNIRTAIFHYKGKRNYQRNWKIDQIITLISNLNGKLNQAGQPLGLNFLGHIVSHYEIRADFENCKLQDCASCIWGCGINENSKI